MIDGQIDVVIEIDTSKWDALRERMYREPTEREKRVLTRCSELWSDLYERYDGPRHPIVLAQLYRGVYAMADFEVSMQEIQNLTQSERERGPMIPEE